MDTCCPPKQIDITGNGIADFKYPRHPLIYYTKNLLPLTLFVLVLQLSSAAVFVALIPDLRYGTAVYHCFVTATTVGYGDVGVSTQEARGFACVHMLLSVAMVGVLISDIDDVRAARRASFKQLNLLKKKLDRELILSLDQDGGGVDKMEFVVGILTEIFKHSASSAEKIMLTIHTEGSAIVGIYTFEIAEQKSVEAMTLSRNNGFPLQLKLEEE